MLFSWQQFVHFSPGGDRLTGGQADRRTGGQADKTSLRAAEGKKFPAVSRPCMNVHFFLSCAFIQSQMQLLSRDPKTKKNRP